MKLIVICFMSSLLLLAISVIICLIGYFFYGRWLAKKWGVDVNNKTPAVSLNDSNDYVPHSKFDVFTHQFSSIAGAGPITGPIIAAMFGWVPVLLWILIGGIFFGAVQDFLSLYASVKEDGKSIGMLIEKYIGKAGKQMFLLFSWLFCMLIIAAFVDIVGTTFNGINATDGSSNFVNGATASISVIFTFVALVFGYFTHKFKLNQILKAVIGVSLLVIMCVFGIYNPIIFSKNIWLYLIIFYMFVVSIFPMWLLKVPRDYFCFFLLFGIIIVSVLGIILINPSVDLGAFNGISVNGKFFFPFLFTTVACGSVSGFHSLISSGTTSKTISKESDMLFVGYGAMLLECILAVVSLIAVSTLSSGNILPSGTPFQIFSKAIGSFFLHFGFSPDATNCVVAMSISTFALSSLDAVGRIGRMSFCEIFKTENKDKSVFEKILTNKFVSLTLTLVGGFVLCIGGYQKIWTLFGAANQLCAALVLMALLVFLKSTKRNEKMLYVPVIFMFAVTMTALIMTIKSICGKFFDGSFVFLVDGLQIIVAVALVVLALEVLYYSVKKLVTK